jgi:ketosteroid isomerase-like protein
MPPGADLVRGRNDIQAFWTAALGQISDLKLTAVDVRPLGSDAAREVGTFTAKTKGQAPQDIAGKYVVVWQKVDGDWKLAADIWNTNK